MASSLYAPLLCAGVDASLRIWEGIPQGDPLSAFLFGSYISLVLQDMERRYPELQACTYVDDSVVYGAPDDLESRIGDVFHSLTEAGLPPHAHKTEIGLMSPVSPTAVCICCGWRRYCNLWTCFVAPLR